MVSQAQRESSSGILSLLPSLVALVLAAIGLWLVKEVVHAEALSTDAARQQEFFKVLGLLMIVFSAAAMILWRESHLNVHERP